MSVYASSKWPDCYLLSLLHWFPHLVCKLAPFYGCIFLQYFCQTLLIGSYSRRAPSPSIGAESSNKRWELASRISHCEYISPNTRNKVQSCQLQYKCTPAKIRNLVHANHTFFVTPWATQKQNRLDFIAIELYNKEEMKRHMSYQILPH
jgi:hypothetical protein